MTDRTADLRRDPLRRGGQDQSLDDVVHIRQVPRLLTAGEARSLAAPKVVNQVRNETVLGLADPVDAEEPQGDEGNTELPRARDALALGYGLGRAVG